MSEEQKGWALPSKPRPTTVAKHLQHLKSAKPLSLSGGAGFTLSVLTHQTQKAGA